MPIYQTPTKTSPVLTSDTWSKGILVLGRLGINNLVVNPLNLGIIIWRKKSINYDQIEIAARLRKSHI